MTGQAEYVVFNIETEEINSVYLIDDMLAYQRHPIKWKKLNFKLV